METALTICAYFVAAAVGIWILIILAYLSLWVALSRQLGRTFGKGFSLDGPANLGNVSNLTIPEFRRVAA